jgi:glutamyl-tRNA synthetase
MYREQGYLPEGLLNYLALLGWSLPRGWPLPADGPPPPGTDPDEPPEDRERDVFALSEMVAAFDLDRVNPNPARFDLKKCTAINGDHIRWLSPEELYERLAEYLRETGLLSEPGHEDLLRAAVPLIQERMQTLGEAPAMLGFLFAAEEDFAVDPGDAAKMLDERGRSVVVAAADALAELPTWSTAEIEAALRSALIDGLGLKPRLAFGPVRVAVTGRRVSPPLFESLELLGRERTLRRLAAAAAD